MYLRTLRGWALLLNAMVGLLDIVSLVTGKNGALFFIINVVGALLFIFGLPSIGELQPQTGRLGQAGLWCLGLAAAMAVVIMVIVFFRTPEVNDLLPLSSALFFLVGSVVVGWLTIRARIFPAVAGGLLIMGSILNLVSGLMPAGLVATLLGISSVVAKTAALAGYGLVILRSPRHMPETFHNAVTERLHPE